MAAPKKMITSCTTRQAKRAYAKVDRSKSTGLTARGYELGVRLHKIWDKEERMRVNKIRRDKHQAKEKAEMLAKLKEGLPADMGYVSPRQKRLSELFALGCWEELEEPAGEFGGVAREEEGEDELMDIDEDVNLDKEGEEFSSQVATEDARPNSELGIEYHDTMDIIQVLDLAEDIDEQVSVKANGAKSTENMTDQDQYGEGPAYFTRMDPEVSNELYRSLHPDDIGILNEVDHPDLMDDACYVTTTNEETEAVSPKPFDESEWPLSSYSPAVVQRDYLVAPRKSLNGSNTPQDSGTADPPFYDPRSPAFYEDLELPTVEDLLFRPSSKRQRFLIAARITSSLLSTARRRWPSTKSQKLRRKKKSYVDRAQREI
ncbi:hypothetical protein MMC17_002756 [Xylographa soralifera]|nr:hypothetical protein [Xylographa soralifera]